MRLFLFPMLEMKEAQVSQMQLFGGLRTSFLSVQHHFCLISLRMWPRTPSFFLILTAIVTGSVSGSWDMVVHPVVNVSRGEDAVLSCSFSHPQQQWYSGEITVKWSMRESQSRPFFSCSVKNDSMEGFSSCSVSGLKYFLDGDPRRREVSLRIREVQLMDDAEYFCRVELEGWRNSYQKKTELYVRAEPQILSLSVVEKPSNTRSHPRRLQCEVEGHPLPKILWLSASRKLTDNQGDAAQSGLYRLISTVPYLEEEELTCRAESELGGAERTYPPSNRLMVTLSVCGLLLLLLLLSTGVVVSCLRHRARANSSPINGNGEVVENHGQRAPNSPADSDAELLYSTVTTTSTSSPPADPIGSTKHHEEPGVLYSEVKVVSSVRNNKQHPIKT
ncbi:sialic acid-binding Ig-like lectin 15 isoform X2 [Trachinotus anak]|uniref:sialic acid-binding Ig-like lectin 15 isoform X2 n=1 Tax=Trachinotus anak TaxID=443729 RepID=UPI0039F17851